jgi:hypothetical protein
MFKQFQQRLNLVFGSIPVFATLTLSSSPCFAATFASSSANAFLHNFSHNPLKIETITDTNTLTFVSSGSVNADANSDALFINQIPFTFARNDSLAKASGYGQKYLGIADSEAAVIGRHFLISAGSTFSFDFLSFLQLNTSIDNPPGESAIAKGNISFFLFDDATQLPIDSFLLSGQLTSLDTQDFFAVEATDGFTFSTDLSIQNTGGNQELITAFYAGTFSRYFSENTTLTLVEVKTNAVIVKAPEPSSFVAFFIFGVAGVALKKRKQS